MFSLEELVAAFDIVDVNPNPARFDQKKAESINGDHIRMLPPAEFAERLVPYLTAAGVDRREPDTGAAGDARGIRPPRAGADAASRRCARAAGLPLHATSSHTRTTPSASLPANANEVLAASVAALEQVPDTEFTAAAVQDALAAALISPVEDGGLGLKPRVAYGPLRVALSGRRISPPLFESMELLGKSESIRRLDALVAFRAR